jgi:DNA polymerase-3 subunit alpha (Gram-positive type)
MVDVTSDSGEVVVAGRVLKCELRELKSGRKLFIFDMTDGTSSVTCKCFPDEARLEGLTGAVKPGAGVKLRGEAQYDKFSDEMCIMMRDASPFAIQETSAGTTRR